MEGGKATGEEEICNLSLKTHKSKVWKHFGFYRKQDGKLDMTHAICKQCRAAIKYVSSTTNMATHMKRRHGVDTSDTASSNSSTDASTGAHKSSSRSSKTGEKSIANFFHSDNPQAANSTCSQAITSAITYFICKDIQPYRVVENEGFQQLLHVLDPRYKIPGRGTFTDTHIPDLYKKVRREIVKSLSSAERVAITVDGWTSCATQSYITVTAHYIDDGWSLKNPVLQTRAFNEEHKGENLAALLRDVCCEWKIGEKEPALVTDNASNMLLAGTLAEMKPHVRCIAHTLNLSSQKALQVEAVSALLVKLRRIVTYFHKSPKACEALHEIQTQLHLKHHKLLHNVSRRWNSSLKMMERFWEQQPAVTLSLTTRRVKTKGLPSITDEELSLLPEIIKLMTPLKVATKILSGEKTPTISIIAPTLAKLQMDFQPNDSDIQVIFEMKEKFRKDFDTRYTYIQELLNKASALDPRFKELEFLDDDDTRDTIFLTITSEVEGMAEGDGSGTLNERLTAEALGDHQSSHRGDDVEDQEKEEDTETEPPKKKSPLDQMFGGFFTPRSPKKSLRDKAKEEIAKYRGRDCLSLNDDVLQWWKEQVDLPLLSKLARSYLSIPATSVPSERVFSTAGDIVTAQCSLLLPEHVDQLIFLKKNLTLSHMK